MSPSIANPYVGPGPFAIEDAGRFFGREHETSDLYSLIAAHRTVLLYAQSGAGKSSLINAGLVPRLEKNGYDVLVAERMAQPVGDVASQTQNIFMANAIRRWSTTAAAPTAELSAVLESRDRKFAADDTRHNYPYPRVLIFDQFEELFIAYPDRWQERRGFFTELEKAMKADKLLRVLFVMREDFVAELDPYEDLLPEEFRTRYRLERLRPEAALDAIEKPLEGTGITYKPGVPELLVTELLKTPIAVTATAGGTDSLELPNDSTDPAYIVEEFVEPVQLQVVCFNLFKKLPAGSTEIDDQHLKAYGDVDEALRAYYKDALRAAQKFASGDSLREWFEKQLITGAGTRGLVFQGDSTTAGIPNAAVKILDEQFHIIRPEVRGNDTWYELSHDRFIRPIFRANNKWRLRRRKAQKKRQYEERNRLAAEARKFRGLSIALGLIALVATIAVLIAAYQWFQAKKATKVADALGQQAAKARMVAEQKAQEAITSAQQSASDRTLAELSQQQAESALNLAKKDESRALAATKDKESALQAEQIALKDANNQADRANARTLEADLAKADETRLKNAAQRDAQISSARALAAISVNRISQDPQLALWLAIYSLFGSTSADAETASDGSTIVTRQSLEALQAAAPATLLLARDKTPCGDIRAVAFSRDHKNIWALDRSGAQIDWDPESTAAQTMGKCQPGIADAEALSPSGRLMAVSGAHRQPSKHPISELLGIHGKVLLFELGDSPGADPKTTVFPAHGYQPEAIAFSSDDKFLAVAGPWTRRAVFDLEDDRQLWGSVDARVRRLSYRVITLLLGRPPRVVSQLAFSPDNQILAVGVEDGIVEFWNTSTGNPTGFLRAHSDPIQSLSFSPDGRLLVTTSRDKSAKIWRVDSPKQATKLHELGGHQDAVLCAAFDPTGQRLATGSQDQTIRIWDVTSGNELLTLPAPGGYVTTLAYSGDGKELVSGSSDGSVRLWDMSALGDERNFDDGVERLRTNAHFEDDVASLSHSDLMDLLSMAQRRARRNLSPTECATYFHGSPALHCRSSVVRILSCAGSRCGQYGSLA